MFRERELSKIISTIMRQSILKNLPFLSKK